MSSRFARTGNPRLGKYDTVFAGFKFYQHINDALAKKAAEQRLDLRTYVRELLIEDALGTSDRRVQREMTAKVAGK